jgi:aldose 1-epimerase
VLSLLKMRITSAPWGTYRGKAATLYTIKNGGLSVSVTDFGATLVHLHLPDRDGKVDDCVLGFDGASAYDDEGNKGPYFGATVGRVANRTCEGKFSLDGKDYTLAVNNGPNALHGGIEGFSWQLWEATVIDVKGAAPAVKFKYVAADMEEGFPGKCTTVCTYSLHDDGALRIQMEATTDQRCPVNLCNHSYFNLGGHDSGSVLGMRLHLNCDRYTPSTATQIPTGELKSVAGTPFDFTTPLPNAHTLAERIDAVEDADGHDSSAGYDHNFVINTGGIQGNPSTLVECATMYDPRSGRGMSIHTNAPGVQLYSANFIDGVVGKGGVEYANRDGFALETQAFPNSINTPNFPSVVVEPGSLYLHTMVLQFSADNAAAKL